MKKLDLDDLITDTLCSIRDLQETRGEATLPAVSAA